MEFMVNEFDLGGDFELLSFYQDLFSMIQDCLFFNRHAIGGIFDEQRDFSLRRSENAHELLVGIELQGQIYDESAVSIDDFTEAVGRSYQIFLNDLRTYRPKLSALIKPFPYASIWQLRGYQGEPQDLNLPGSSGPRTRYTYTYDHMTGQHEVTEPDIITWVKRST
ncbi:MAG: hypothetical protein GDA35_08080 [Hyphomonadaceae bacterium]|nr:hypothetical protein [Hyphomonadaceae bacterium]